MKLVQAAASFARTGSCACWNAPAVVLLLVITSPVCWRAGQVGSVDVLTMTSVDRRHIRLRAPAVLAAGTGHPQYFRLIRPSGGPSTLAGRGRHAGCVVGRAAPGSPTCAGLAGLGAVLGSCRDLARRGAAARRQGMGATAGRCQ